MDWHIALAQPNLEHTAFSHLRRLQYRVYYPVFPKMRSFRGCLRPVYRPMFPGYLFVQRGANQDWRRLETAPGIRVTHSLLSRDDGYATITVEELDQVKETAKWLCEQIHEAMKPHHFKVGDQVRITEGPFASFLAIIETLDDDGRNIGLLAHIFERQTRIRAKSDHLTAA
jgi:transcription antitermination factor NusG